MSSTTKFILPFVSSYVTPILVSVPTSIAPIISWTASVVSWVFADAIVMFTPSGVKVTLLPATNFKSCVPAAAPDFVNLNNTSLVLSTKDVA